MSRFSYRWEQDGKLHQPCLTFVHDANAWRASAFSRSLAQFAERIGLIGVIDYKAEYLVGGHIYVRLSGATKDLLEVVDWMETNSKWLDTSPFRDSIAYNAELFPESEHEEIA